MMDWLQTQQSALTDHRTDNMDLYRGKRFALTNASIDNQYPAVMIIFILLILVLNLALIVFIFISKVMRQNSKHVLIISLCLADLILGVFVIPVILSMSSESEDCSLFHAVRVFAELLIPSVATLAVLALNVDYILRMCLSSYSEGPPRVILIMLLFLLPWAVSCGVLNPLYVSGLKATGDRFWWENCKVSIEGGTYRKLLILSFVPQASALLLSNIIVSILYLVRRETHTLDAMGERIRAPVDICLASFVTILFYTPSFLHQLLGTDGYQGCTDQDECNVVNTLQLTAMFFMFAKSWFMPLCWMVGKETRSAIRHIFDCC